MSYEAVLVSRRGLGVDELRMIAPPFAEALRWALYAEALSAELEELRTAAAAPTPDGLTGERRTAFMATRTHNRAVLQEREAILFPSDEAPDG